MGDSYFKTNSVFYKIDLVFFTEPTRFLFRTNLIALQNRLDSLNRTDSLFLQNRLGFFTEPSQFFELVVLHY